MQVSFIGGGNRNKLPICLKSLTNLSPYVVSSIFESLFAMFEI